MRPALIKAAVELLNENGDASFGLRDLAARVGVSHPALYRHFTDRATLFAAIAYEGFSLYAESQKEVLINAPESAQEKLVILAHNHVRFAIQHPGYFRVMFGARIGEHKLNDDSLSVVARPTLELIATVAASLGKNTPMDFALILWAAVHGIALLGLDGQLAFFGKSFPDSLNPMVESSIRYLIKGYLNA